MSFMSGRPCNPDSDFKRLWQVLLRGTPFPQCNVPHGPESAIASAEDERSDTTHSGDRAIGGSAAGEG
jgi:hypothetical protein